MFFGVWTTLKLLLKALKERLFFLARSAANGRLFRLREVWIVNQ